MAALKRPLCIRLLFFLGFFGFLCVCVCVFFFVFFCYFSSQGLLLTSILHINIPIGTLYIPRRWLCVDRHFYTVDNNRLALLSVGSYMTHCVLLFFASFGEVVPFAFYSQIPRLAPRP